MNLHYEIDELNTIRVWNLENPNENNAPFLLQPDWPNATPWADRAEAESWANIFVESLKNPESEFIAGKSRDNHPMKRPEPSHEETTSLEKE